MSILFNRVFQHLKGVNRSGMVHLTGSFLTSTNGTISTQDCPGFTVTKTATKTGRYTVQLVDTDGTTAAVATQATVSVAPWSIQSPHVTVCSPTADAALTDAKGWFHAIRDFASHNGTFKIQFFTAGTDNPADAELEDGATVFIDFWVKLSTASP